MPDVVITVPIISTQFIRLLCVVLVVGKVGFKTIKHFCKG